MVVCVIMAKKKKYSPPKQDEEEIEKFKEHSKIINEKMKAITQKYKKWWDIKTGTWKEGFEGHGEQRY